MASSMPCVSPPAAVLRKCAGSLMVRQGVFEAVSAAADCLLLRRFMLMASGSAHHRQQNRCSRCSTTVAAELGHECCSGISGCCANQVASITLYSHTCRQLLNLLTAARGWPTAQLSAKLATSGVDINAGLMTNMNTITSRLRSAGAHAL